MIRLSGLFQPVKGLFLVTSGAAGAGIILQPQLILGFRVTGLCRGQQFLMALLLFCGQIRHALHQLRREIDHERILFRQTVLLLVFF